MFAHLQYLTAVAALPAAPDPNNPFSGWIGKPDVAWLGPLKEPMAKITGMGLGAVIIISIIMFAVAAAMIVFAGKHQHKREGAAQFMLNIVYGLAAILIGLPLFILIIGAVFGMF